MKSGKQDAYYRAQVMGSHSELRDYREIQGQWQKRSPPHKDPEAGLTLQSIVLGLQAYQTVAVGRSEQETGPNVH